MKCIMYSWGKGIVHEYVFQFGAHLRGHAVGGGGVVNVPKVVAKSDGTIGEIQGGGARQIMVVLHNFLVAAVQHWLLLDDSVDQIRRTEACRRHDR